MNQDQIKLKLLEIRNDVPDFAFIFSGKKSKKVNGLYKPETKEIIIHNKNHETDNELIYTSIHEFAHHIQFFENPIQKSSSSHNTTFWNIFHQLLYRAEQKKIYQSIYRSDSEFVELTKKIKENFLTKHGALMKEFGILLMKALELCQKKNTSFEDYISRELLMDKSEVKNIIRVSSSKIDPSVGYENMVLLANIKDDDKKEEIEKGFLENTITPVMIKEELKQERRPHDKLELLMSEKIRLERAIQTLEKNLKQIEEKIEEIKTDK